MKRSLPAALALTLGAPVDAQERPSVAPKAMQAIAPALAGYTDHVLFGDVWVRPDLSPRDRSLVTLSVLIASGKTAQLGGHLGRGLTNGIKPTEIAGMVTHLAFYTGWPNAVSALSEIEKVFAERKIDPATLLSPSERQAPLASSEAARAAMVNAQIAPTAPKFAELTNKVVFGDLWRRTDLSPRDRSVVTIVALAANGDSDQLGFHIRLALENGVTRREIVEAFTHLAFYAGWPRASGAIAVASKIFGAAGTGGPAAQVVSPGVKPARGPAANFTGAVTVSSPFEGTGDARLGGATVTFQPGARSNWHKHPLGQLLVVTAGNGWVQAEGEPVRAMTAGDVVWTGPGVKHWHGATRTEGMTHVAVAETSPGESVTWLEPVADDQYPAR
jgi:4-carboxymuconolactone decarboxylase